MSLATESVVVRPSRPAICGRRMRRTTGAKSADEGLIEAGLGVPGTAGVADLLLLEARIREGRRRILACFIKLSLTVKKDDQLMIYSRLGTRTYSETQ